MATAQYVAEPKHAGSTAKGVSAWRDVVHLLAQAAAMHAVHLQTSDLEPLQARFLQTLESLKGEPSEETVRTTGTELASELERYNRSTQRAVTAALGGLRETVAALSHGLQSLTEQTELGPQIEALEAIVTNAKTPDELEMGRAQIEEIIALVGEKERARTTRFTEFVRELQGRIDELEQNAHGNSGLVHQPAQVSPSHLDVLTGIPNGAAAREAILHAQALDPLPHLAVMHIQSLDLLNARFGQRIGDQLVLTCCQHLASNLCRENDRIFRWRGPAFVALLERDDSPAGVAREISHVCNSISASFFGEAHRSILIPVKMVSTTLPIESRLITEVFDSIERFLVRAGRPSL